MPSLSSRLFPVLRSQRSLQRRMPHVILSLPLHPESSQYLPPLSSRHYSG